MSERTSDRLDRSPQLYPCRTGTWNHSTGGSQTAGIFRFRSAKRHKRSASLPNDPRVGRQHRPQILLLITINGVQAVLPQPRIAAANSPSSPVPTNRGKPGTESDSPCSECNQAGRAESNHEREVARLGKPHIKNECANEARNRDRSGAAENNGLSKPCRGSLCSKSRVSHGSVADRLFNIRKFWHNPDGLIWAISIAVSLTNCALIGC